MPQNTITTEEMISAYRQQVVLWLQRKEAKWRETSQSGLGAASDAASFYAAAYRHAWKGIVDCLPEKRAEE